MHEMVQDTSEFRSQYGDMDIRYHFLHFLIAEEEEEERASQFGGDLSAPSKGQVGHHKNHELLCSVLHEVKG